MPSWGNTKNCTIAGPLLNATEHAKLQVLLRAHAYAWKGAGRNVDGHAASSAARARDGRRKSCHTRLPSPLHPSSRGFDEVHRCANMALIRQQHA